MTRPAESVAMLVLSPPRSGTSAISHFLNHCGFDFGDPAHFVDTEVHKHNPVFFELEWVNQINDAVLERFGVSFKTGCPPEAGAYDTLQLKDLRSQACDLVKSEWPSASRIGIKDPRFCFTLPFWRQVLESMGYRVALVWSLRSPAATVASNSRLVPDWSQRRLCDFWTRCVLSGRHVIGNEPCTLLDYDWMSTDPLAFAQDAVARLNLDVPDVAATVRHVSLLHRHEAAQRLAAFPEVDALDDRFRAGQVSADEYGDYRRMARLFHADLELDEQARQRASDAAAFERQSRERISLIQSLEIQLKERDALLAEQRRQSAELAESQARHIEKLSAMYRDTEALRVEVEHEAVTMRDLAARQQSESEAFQRSQAQHIAKLEALYLEATGLAESRAEHIAKLETLYRDAEAARARLDYEVNDLRVLIDEQARQSTALQESQREHIGKLEAMYRQAEEQRAWLDYEAKGLRSEISRLQAEAVSLHGRNTQLDQSLAHRGELLRDFIEWVADRRRRTVSIEVGGIVDGVNRLLRRKAA